MQRHAFRFLALPMVCCAITGCALLGGTSHGGSDTPTTTSAESKEHAASAPTASFPEASRALAQAQDEFANDWGTPPPKVLRAYPMDTHWGMNRTPAGIITGRVTRAVLFIRGGQSGKCRQLLCNLREEEQGGQWGPPVIQCLPEYTTNVTCESVDSLRASM
jgi:hypothetical protein